VLVQLSNENGLEKNIEVAVMSQASIDVTDFAHTRDTLTIDNNG